MVTFPDGLASRFHAAWLACHDLALHLPDQQEFDSQHCADAVARFYVWARGDVLKNADAAISQIAAQLRQPATAVKLMETAKELFRLWSPERPKTREVKVWDRRTFRPRHVWRFFPPLNWYETAIRTRLEDPEVRDRSRALLQFDRSGLLEKITEEFRQAAATEPRQAPPPSINDLVGLALGPVAEGDGDRPNESQEDVIQTDPADILDEEPVSSDAVVKQLHQRSPRISSKLRTRPLGLQEAALLMGHKGPRAHKLLRAAMNDGAVVYEQWTRQQFIFDRRLFPDESLCKVVPTESK
jgi:hypothetical protein